MFSEPVKTGHLSSLDHNPAKAELCHGCAIGDESGLSGIMDLTGSDRSGKVRKLPREGHGGSRVFAVCVCFLRIQQGVFVYASANWYFCNHLVVIIPLVYASAFGLV
jgi:hypothetical protein